MKRYIRVLCLILAVALTFMLFAACDSRSPYKYSHGDFGSPSFKHTSVMMGVRSDQDEFSTDDVVLQLYYGFYDLNSKDAADIQQDKRLSGYHKENDTLFFALYITDESVMTMKKNYDEPVDPENVSNWHYIKTITEEEAASKEYAYKESFLYGTYYNHNEPIKIPPEVFQSKGIRGSFYIVIEFFTIPEGSNDAYFANYESLLKISYSKTNENSIKVVF